MSARRRKSDEKADEEQASLLWVVQASQAGLGLSLEAEVSSFADRVGKRDPRWQCGVRWVIAAQVGRGGLPGRAFLHLPKSARSFGLMQASGKP